jgi:hypothetical protein
LSMLVRISTLDIAFGNRKTRNINGIKESLEMSLPTIRGPLYEVRFHFWMWDHKAWEALESVENIIWPVIRSCQNLADVHVKLYIGTGSFNDDDESRNRARNILSSFLKRRRITVVVGGYLIHEAE